MVLCEILCVREQTGKVCVCVCARGWGEVRVGTEV